MKLNPKTYSLKQAKMDIESCNRLIVSKSEDYITLKKTLDNLQNTVYDLANKKIYIKRILKEKLHFVKHNNSRNRIKRLLKQ